MTGWLVACLSVPEQEHRNLPFMQELRNLFSLMVGSKRKYVDPSRAVEILKDAFKSSESQQVSCWTPMTSTYTDISSSLIYIWKHIKRGQTVGVELFSSPRVWTGEVSCSQPSGPRPHQSCRRSVYQWSSAGIDLN